MCHAGIAKEAVVSVIPAFARAMLHRELLCRRIRALGTAVVVPIYSVIMFLPSSFVEFENHNALLTFAIVYILLFPAAVYFRKLINEQPDSRRYAQYDEAFRKFQKQFKFQITINIVMCIGLIVVTIYFVFPVRWKVLGISFLMSSVVLLSMAALGILYFQIFYGRILNRNLPPDYVAIRSLADAFATTTKTGAPLFRNFARRREIARFLAIAARAVERGMGHRFAASTDPAGTLIVQPNLQLVAASLRSRLSWLATPKPDTQPLLARALAEDLAAFVTGDLDRLVRLAPEIVELPSLSWRRRLLNFAQWFVVAIVPGVIVAVLWRAGAFDPTTGTLATQFAVLSFIVGTLTAVDPGGRDKLASVGSLGTSMFGWGKKS
jgi:hypothetical protein